MKMYAGFWLRAGAFALDYVIILVYLIVITLFSLLMNSIFSINQWLFGDRVRAQLTGFLLITLPVTLYFAFGESSIRQATWGKRRLRLKVTDLHRNRIRFWRSLARSGLKFIPWELAHTLIWQISFTQSESSTLIAAGFVTVYLLLGANLAALVLRKDRRTLYDLLTGTCVIRT